MAGKKTTILAVDDDHLLQVTISRLGSKLEPDPTPPRLGPAICLSPLLICKREGDEVSCWQVEEI